MTPIDEQLRSLVQSIKGLHSTIDRLSNCFDVLPILKGDHTFDKNSADDWRILIYDDALKRLLLVLENNFRLIETISLVAVTRYIFELNLWLELIQDDPNYALVYQRRLIDTQKRHYESSLKQFEREVALLREFGEKDRRSMNKAGEKISRISNPSPEDVSAIFTRARDDTDAKAARSFSVYSDQARENGYNYQAYLVETQAIPKAKQSIQQLQEELDVFDRESSARVAGLLQCSKWDKMAEKVNMTAEYEYIYSQTSKLLHCTPSSMTTSQKNLETEEAVVFLRYIYTKIRDIIDLALKQPECAIRFE